MKTKLYIPFTGFVINNEKGEKILYENLVQSGPAYQLVVHESPEWLRIKDEMPRADIIEIIPEKKAQEYKEIVNKFFSPITEAAPFYEFEGEKYPSDNLTMDLRRALTYIMIGYDYKARIYEDDILKETSSTSRILMDYKDVFSEDAINRVMFVEKLIMGYRKDDIDTISINQDSRIFNDLMDLLDKEKIELLSEKNHLFGVLNTKKDMLKRDLRELIAEILNEEWLPYLVRAPTLALSYYSSLPKIMQILTFLSDLASKVLAKYDFREYAPPIQDPKLYLLGKGEGSFMFTWFNYEYKFFKK